MRDQGKWISLQRAVAAVHAVTGRAPGPVYQTLISLCADGLVRARWTEHASKTQPAIPRRDWIGASIDWSSPSGRIDKADGNGMAGVDFSEDDLNDWAKSRSTDAIKATDNEADLDVGHRTEAAIERNGSGVRMTTHVTAEEACGAWIRSLPPEPRPKKGKLKTAALAAHQGLSDIAFDRQWALHAPASWKHQGRFKEKKPPT
jgi:hypothetical protein